MSTSTALTPEQVRALPAMCTTKQAFAALALGKTLGYQLIEAGEFPVEVIRVGRVFRVRKVDLLSFLGLSETAAAEVQSAPAANDGAPGVQPGAPTEQPAPTSK